MPPRKKIDPIVISAYPCPVCKKPMDLWFAGGYWVNEKGLRYDIWKCNNPNCPYDCKGELLS